MVRHDEEVLCSDGQSSQISAFFQVCELEREFPPPSRHSSNQNHLRLCRSQESPIKEPHISARRRIRAFCSLDNVPSASFVWKKSFRLKLGLMPRHSSLLYSNAFSIKSQTVSRPEAARSLGIAVAFGSKACMISATAYSEVLVLCANFKTGLSSVPWTQFGPLSASQPKFSHVCNSLMSTPAYMSTT